MKVKVTRPKGKQYEPRTVKVKVEREQPKERVVKVRFSRA